LIGFLADGELAAGRPHARKCYRTQGSTA
jgi:hypothetical protein